MKWAYVDELKPHETAIHAALRSLHMTENGLSHFLATA